MNERYQNYLESDTWAEKREAARLRALGRCEFCGAAMEHVHHVRYPKRLGDESLDDLVAVCKTCHDKSHGVRQMNLQPIPDAKAVDVSALSGRKITVAISENGNAYANLLAWMDAIEVPSTRRQWFTSVVTSATMRADSGRLPRGLFNGQEVYSWQAVCFAMRAVDRKYHRLGEPTCPRPAEITVAEYQPMVRFIKNVDAVTQWGWDQQSKALAALMTGRTQVVPTAPAEILEGIRLLASGHVQHEARLAKLESATQRNGNEGVTVSDACLELNLDELRLVRGGLNLSQLAGMELKAQGCASIGKIERRPHGMSQRIYTNIWHRRDAYRVLGMLVERDYSHLLVP